MGKPVVMRRPDGAEYGFESEEVGLQMFPDAKPVRYQDGTPIDGVVETEVATSGFVHVDDLMEFFGQFKRDTLDSMLRELGHEDPDKLKNKTVAAEHLVGALTGTNDEPVTEGEGSEPDPPADVDTGENTENDPVPDADTGDAEDAE